MKTIDIHSYFSDLRYTSQRSLLVHDLFIQPLIFLADLETGFTIFNSLYTQVSTTVYTACLYLDYEAHSKEVNCIVLLDEVTRNLAVVRFRW